MLSKERERERERARARERERVQNVFTYIPSTYVYIYIFIYIYLYLFILFIFIFIDIFIDIQMQGIYTYICMYACMPCETRRMQIYTLTFVYASSPTHIPQQNSPAAPIPQTRQGHGVRSGGWMNNS